jgi:hypothetical protein
MVPAQRAGRERKHVRAQRPPKSLLTFGTRLYDDLCSQSVTERERRLGESGADSAPMIDFNCRRTTRAMRAVLERGGEVAVCKDGARAEAGIRDDDDGEQQVGELHGYKDYHVCKFSRLLMTNGREP